jgi:2-amino-4-hydroxy-6-hydroxymethyldihydropteridine diphosphokinase
MKIHQGITTYLGLGGNLGDPLAAFCRTRQKLSAHPAIRDCRSSPLYQTPPVGGPADQPDYLNAALIFKTDLAAAELLTLCLTLEQAEGRERKEHWGARTLDIDLLLFGEQQITENGLEVPHPRLMERQFVLLPLVALTPALQHPVSGVGMQRQLEMLPHIENIKILQLDW